MTTGIRRAGRRHRARELALRVLFELEGTDKDADVALAYQADDLTVPDDVRAFAHEIVDGCLRHAEELDAAIAAASSHWSLTELGKVERAVLRLGAYELRHRPDVPVAVAIDEAVELAKIYVGTEAGAFVNGVLARLAEDRSGRAG
ncbi:MAG: transcription antitermination factor NusB [Candidatus Dormibacteria bacterium]